MLTNSLKETKNLFFILLIPLLGNSQWNQIGSVIPSISDNDAFGNSVSLNADGSIIAVGSLSYDDPTETGFVKVLHHTSGNWVQVGNDIHSVVDGELGDSLSLSADGTIVVIGAPHFYGSNGSNSGYTQVHQNISGTWSQISGDLEGEATNDYSGWAVSISAIGSRVAIEAGDNNGNGHASGHVRVYDNIGNSWMQIGSDIDGEAADNYSGTSVSLSDNSTIVAIGAPWNTSPNGAYSGHVRVYGDALLSVTETNFVNQISLFPNPSSNNATIQFKNTYDHINVSVFDIQGKEILNEIKHNIKELTLETN